MKFLLFLALLVACAQAESEEIDPLLVSGTLAAIGEFPSAVFIRAPGTPLLPLCGGTIINRDHVSDYVHQNLNPNNFFQILTSAQCVLNGQNQLINPFWFTVTAGDIHMITPTSRRVIRSLSRIFVHPNFNPTTRNK